MFLATLIRQAPKDSPTGQLRYAIVSESGASVYSASLLAQEELPDLDISYRGAVSIARRLQARRSILFEAGDLSRIGSVG